MFRRRKVQSPIKITIENVNISITNSTVTGDVTAIAATVENEIQKILDNEIDPPSFHETWWGAALIGVAVTVAGGGILYWLGWL